MHCYVVAHWKWVPILFTFECLVEGGTIINIKSVIMVTLIMYGGLTNKEIFEWASVFKNWWHLHISGDQI
jgi:hypothetical protein